MVKEEYLVFVWQMGNMEEMKPLGQQLRFYQIYLMKY